VESARRLRQRGGKQRKFKARANLVFKILFETNTGKSFMRIDYTCKICHRPGVTSVDDLPPDITPESADEYERRVVKLMPLLSHDQCFDLRFKKRDATEAIAKACNSIARLKLFKFNKDEFDRTIERARDGLIPATRSWVSVISKQLGTESNWSETLVDSLIEDPSQASMILDAYKNSLTAQAGQELAIQ
jgi:hypothetical protein